MLVAKASMAKNNPELKILINTDNVPNEQRLTLIGVEVDNQFTEI